LNLALGAAANRQIGEPPDERISMVQAERIATDVGISTAEFRSALWAVREQQELRGGLLGPDGVQVVQDSFAMEVSPSAAVHMLTQAQSAVPMLGGSIENPAEGVWRVQAGSNAALQVATRSGETTVTAASNK